MAGSLDDRLDLASALHVAGQLDKAEPLYREVIAEAPLTRVAHNNLIALLRTQRRWPELEAVFRAAAALWPEDASLVLRLAHLVLADGRYAEGWPLYEARRRVPGAPVVPRLPAPEWTGEPVGRLLVWSEQGFGDSLQFARYLPVLQGRGIGVDFVCQPELTRVLRDAGANAVGRGAVKLEQPDAWVLAGSLPWRLATTLETIPPPAPVVGAEGGRGVGVMTLGSPGHLNDRNRSLPPEAAARLMGLPGAVDLHPQATGAADFAATAEIIRSLALVVTVDTAVAHLAASMGKPTWILLPHLNTDWRWLRERTDSPWYPSARLYRQPSAGAWDPVIDQVERDLQDLA